MARELELSSEAQTKLLLVLLAKQSLSFDILSSSGSFCVQWVTGMASLCVWAGGGVCVHVCAGGGVYHVQVKVKLI